MSQKPHIIIGSNDWNLVPQWGRIARTEAGEEVGLDLNTTSTGIMTGAQGTGKSYALGVITENFLTPLEGMNHLPVPGCALVFHYSQSQDYRPELTLMNQPNSAPKEVSKLAQWGGKPKGVDEVIIVTPGPLVAARQAEFPGYQVVPLLFHESEVGVDSYINLMGDASISSFEVEVLLDMMEGMRDSLNPAAILAAVRANTLLTEVQRNFLELKVTKATKYITQSSHLMPLFKPGRLIIVDLRDEFLPKSMAFRIMLCMLNIFQNVRAPDGSRFPKLLIADEAHEYANDAFLVESFVRLVRLMRHKALTILLASQDPMSVDDRLKMLASFLIMLNMESEVWVQDLARCKMAINGVQPSQFCGLEAGQCWIWSRFATDQRFVRIPQRCEIRPRASMHGGFTKTAIQV